MTGRQTTLDSALFIERPSPRGPPATKAELCKRAAEYAQTVALNEDLSTVSWKVSSRAKRRAGACRYNSHTGAITIRLTWKAHRKFGWEQFKRVIRHELIHAWEFQTFGESSHGDRFKRKADELNVDVHCPKFVELRLLLECEDHNCHWEAHRYRASKAVSQPEQRRCGSCHSRYRVTHVATGRSWQTNREYRKLRKEIGGEW
ncbi:SprT-like domain-containing protein [Haloarchaeobius amylolyticus]|uniref:SprT-like domain-containing protein n=1 Tax=Haloarchaeobius amylolyticus TaxID=1198296 RepID=UPI00226F9304|nr:SprT-like domain-containing protein [Haloarchaeobius amylolyticus]